MQEAFTFHSEGLALRGWLFRPQANGPHPAIVMSHGFGAVKEMGLRPYAEAFCAAGFMVLVYDHRNLGESDGTPRDEVDPFAQVNDMRTAIGALQTLPDVDPSRIGLWGTSYAGAHVLKVAAVDRRVRCVVSQVPLIDGYENIRSFTGAVGLRDLQATLNADRAERATSGQGGLVAVSARDASTPHVFPGTRTWEFNSAFKQDIPEGRWNNLTTWRSLDLALEYSVMTYMKRISPTPLLLIVAEVDEITPTAIALDAYAKALEPKALKLLPGDHYTAYFEERAAAIDAARSWFSEHLG